MCGRVERFLLSALLMGQPLHILAIVVSFGVCGGLGGISAPHPDQIDGSLMNDNAPNIAVRLALKVPFLAWICGI